MASYIRDESTLINSDAQSRSGERCRLMALRLRAIA